MSQAAPGPYNTLEIGAHTASSGCHIYLTDATGRKIGVVWGKADEKAFTAHHLIQSANGHDALTSALRDCVAFMRGDIVGSVQKAGIIKEALAALKDADRT